MNMKPKLKAVIIVVMMVLSFLASASSVNLSQLKVRDLFYPEGFQEELQENLNFFTDGYGVDPGAVVPYREVWVTKDGRSTHTFSSGNVFTDITAIGLYLNILVEVEKAGYDDALIRIGEVLDTLEATPKYRGLMYSSYTIKNSKLVPSPSRVVNGEDNASLAMALTAVAGAYIDSGDPAKKNIVHRINTFLNNQKKGWSEMYDHHRGLLSVGWRAARTKRQQTEKYYISRKGDSSRTAPLWAVLITRDMGKNAVPMKAFENMEIYTASYNFGGKPYTPILTKNGSTYEAMLPAIWLNEKALVPDYTLFKDAISLHLAFADQNNIPMVSNSATTFVNSRAAFGVPSLSEGYVRFNDLSCGCTGTPHATALAYIIKPEDSVTSLKALKAAHPGIKAKAGWYDAIDFHGNISIVTLAMNQGMFVASFLAKSINSDVEQYMKDRGYWEDIKTMYRSFVPPKAPVAQKIIKSWKGFCHGDNNFYGSYGCVGHVLDK